MRMSKRINQFVHRVMIHYVLHQYHKACRKIEKKHPELFKPVNSTLSQKHRALWSKLGATSGDHWLRFHVNLTGIEDYTFCPGDIFFSRIERILNDCNASGMGLEDKNELWRYVPKGAEPKVYLRYVRGSFFDRDAQWVSEEDAGNILRNIGEDVIGKPCRSSGGKGVVCFKWNNGKHQDGKTILTPEWIKQQGQSYIVQEKIKQDEFCSSFNASSTNTLRMATLRCPWNGEVVICRSMMRMGVSDAVVDNMSRGGLCVCIGENGQFDKYAYDYDGKRFTEHPVSKQTFEGLVHPGYFKIVELAKRVAAQIPYYNLLSFDFIPREDGSVCVVEINAVSQGIIQLQYGFGGLFGKYTEQLVDWCAKHQDLDAFEHFRTWY